MAPSATLAAHLARRCAGSLWPGGPGRATEAWVRDVLRPGEVAMWRKMSGADRRHAAGVARRVQVSVRNLASPPVLAAALLHDVGKTASGLGTAGRVMATIAGMAAGRHHAERWAGGRGMTRRIGLYLLHGPIGADMLAAAGSDPLTVSWAREHHLCAAAWTVPPDIGAALKAADDD